MLLTDLLAGGWRYDHAKVALEVQDVQERGTVAHCNRGIHQRAHLTTVGRVTAGPRHDWL